MLASLVSWWSTYMLHPLEGNGYQFWSGIGSDLQEPTLIVGIALFLRHHNCHVHGCWRRGFVVFGTSYLACSHHHPRRDECRKVTPEVIADAKAQYEAARVSANSSTLLPAVTE